MYGLPDITVKITVQNPSHLTDVYKNNEIKHHLETYWRLIMEPYKPDGMCVLMGESDKNFSH